jgi:hypothetical protein
MLFSTPTKALCLSETGFEQTTRLGGKLNNKGCAMSSMVMSVKDACGEPLEASVEWVKGNAGLQWNAGLWANGYLAHVISGSAKFRADIPQTLQEAIIFLDLRAPLVLAA